MKKISEMTLEELQDYAVELENDKATKDQAIADRDNKIAELTGLNTTLQKRNNDLFMKVEQQGYVEPLEPKEPTTPPVESIEDVAKNNYKEFIKL